MDKETLEKANEIDSQLQILKSFIGEMTGKKEGFMIPPNPSYFHPKLKDRVEVVINQYMEQLEKELADL